MSIGSRERRPGGVVALVVGDLMLDRYLEVEAGRISPEAPVPVAVLRGEWDRPGGASNVAASLAGLGGRVALAGVIGEDEDGRRLRRALEEHGVDASPLLERPGLRTICKTRVVSGVGRQQLIRLDQDGDRAALEAAAEALAARALPAIERADVAVISDYDKGTVTEALAVAVVRACRARASPASSTRSGPGSRRSPARRRSRRTSARPAGPSAGRWPTARRSPRRPRELREELGDRPRPDHPGRRRHDPGHRRRHRAPGGRGPRGRRRHRGRRHRDRGPGGVAGRRPADPRGLPGGQRGGRDRRRPPRHLRRPGGRAGGGARRAIAEGPRRGGGGPSAGRGAARGPPRRLHQRLLRYPARRPPRPASRGPGGSATCWSSASTPTARSAA